ncbi:MAG: AEC family transporter [Lentisphaeria bacterium]|nr:AEC family transporter [Lentisphaeria bacterium]
MELGFKILLGIVKTFCFFSLGALALRLKIFSHAEAVHFGRFAIDILTPFLTFYSIVCHFTRQDGAAFWQLPLTGFGIVLFGMLCGLVLQFGMKKKTPRRMATFVHLAALNNFLFLPLILLDSLYGMKAVGYLFLMSVGSTVGFWTCGVFSLAGSDWKLALKNLCSSNIAAVILAVVCVLLEIPVPGAVMELCREIGQGAVPLSLALTGCMVFSTGRRLLAYRYDAIYTLLVRLVILPVLTLLVLRQLPLAKPLMQVAVLVALMPASCSSVLIVRQYGGSADFASQSIVLSTIGSMVTVPVFLYLIAWWL